MTRLFNASDKLANVYVQAPIEEIIIHTIELSHPNFSKVHRLVAYPEDLTCNISLTGSDMQLFTAYPFRVNLPVNDAQGQQSLSIALANATPEISAELEMASKNPLEVIQLVYRVYLLSDLSILQATPIRLAINALGMTHESINASASRIDLLNRPFPNTIYRNDLFPGLVR